MRLLVILALLLTACLPPPTAPEIWFVSPGHDEDLITTSPLVEVEVSNFIFDAANLGGAPVEGFGHMHLFLTPEEGAEKLVGVFGEANAWFLRLPVGYNNLRAELVQNDHSSFSVPVDDNIYVTVLPETRSIRILSPEPGPPYPNDPVTLDQSDPILFEVAVGGFTLKPDQMDGAPDPCSCAGHWHLLIDGQLALDWAEELVSITETWGDLGEGLHEVEVRLAANDHSDIQPLVFDKMLVDIQF